MMRVPAEWSTSLYVATPSTLQESVSRQCGAAGPLSRCVQTVGIRAPERINTNHDTSGSRCRLQQECDIQKMGEGWRCRHVQPQLLPPPPGCCRCHAGWCSPRARSRRRGPKHTPRPAPSIPAPAACSGHTRARTWGRTGAAHTADNVFRGTQQARTA